MRSLRSIRPAIKCHGGKYFLSQWITSQSPERYPDLSYVEPFCGGASVLLNEPRSAFEVINDLDPAVQDPYTAMRDDAEQFPRELELLDYSGTTFHRAIVRQGPVRAGVDRAGNKFVLRRMSRGGLRTAFAWSERLRGGQPVA